MTEHSSIYFLIRQCEDVAAGHVTDAAADRLCDLLVAAREPVNERMSIETTSRIIDAGDSIARRTL